jgi:hypothetical protein
MCMAAHMGTDRTLASPHLVWTAGKVGCVITDLNYVMGAWPAILYACLALMVYCCC